MNNAAIDIAIGLGLMYVLFSLACIILNQIIARAARLRASTLQAGLGKLLDDPDVKAAFYDHGLIASACAASGGRHPSHLTGTTFAMALIGSLDNSRPLPGITELDAAVKRLPDSRIRDILLAHLSVASGDMIRLRETLSNWYDESMIHLKAVYERRMRLIALAVATLLVVPANADTFDLAQALWTDRPIRDQIAQASSETLAANTASPHPSSNTRVPYPSTTLSYLKGMDEDIRPFPLGWHAALYDADEKVSAFRFWISKVFGLLVTIAFVTYGASFCFDLLAKIVDIRGSGGRPHGAKSSSPG